MSDKKRCINDLRVIDLRAELEKRKLDKNGVRAVLLKRLAQFLKDEGHDPETYQFDPLGADSKGTPSKRSSHTDSFADGTEDADEAMVDVRVEDMIVQEEVGDEDEDEPDKSAPAAAEPAKPDPSDKSTSMETGPKTPVAETNKRKREIKEELESTEAKKPKAEEPEKAKKEAKASVDVKVELNNTDAEDSINLDIGEDELLNEDGDSAAKTQKDEGGDARKKAATKAASASSTAASAGASAAKHHHEQQVKIDGHTTSESTDEKKEKEDKDAKGDSEAGGKKDENKDSSAGARNLWVSGLSGDTRAKDLKQLCSKHGKVVGAKVVTNARTPGSRCYGYVTMASAQDAENCIENLDRTELHGRLISVEKAKSEASGGPSSARRKDAAKDENNDVKKDENGEAKEGEREKKSEGSRSRSRDPNTAKSGGKDVRRRSRDRKRSPRDALSFNKILRERDAQRARERSRAARDEERRRRQAEAELRERERQQRIENRRLALERQKLRQERERIEREKKELLRLERERHKLEREKLELERLELKRAQQRLEEERRKRAYEPPPTYRKPTSPPPPPYERDARHKRPPLPIVRATAVPAKYNASGRSGFEPPPPPRFEMAAPAYERAADKRPERADYKRDYNSRHVSSSAAKYPSNGTSADDARQALPPASRPKEPARTTYEGRERGAGYRSPPPAKTEPRAWASSSRYADSAAAAKDYGERSGGGWSSSGGAASKSYPSSRHVTAPASSQNWSKPSGGGSSAEPWQSSGGGESRYGSGYEARSYPASYQPPPPGSAPYVDRYAQPASRDYRPKY